MEAEIYFTRVTMDGLPASLLGRSGKSIRRYGCVCGRGKFGELSSCLTRALRRQHTSLFVSFNSDRSSPELGLARLEPLHDFR